MGHFTTGRRMATLSLAGSFLAMTACSSSDSNAPPSSAAGGVGNGGTAGNTPVGGAAGVGTAGGNGGRDAAGGTAGAPGGGVSNGGAGGASGGVSGAPAIDPTCTGSCTTECEQGCFELGACAAAGGGTLDVVANPFTAGVVLSGAGAATTGDVYYRRAGAGTWWKGTELVRLPDGRLATSLFSLLPATAYEIRAEAGAVTACSAVTTESEVLPGVGTTALYVDGAAAGGGDGSSGKPFKTIQEAVNAATAGSVVTVRAGVYREAVQVTKSGTAGKYLSIKGESGAILDGADAGALAGLTWKDEGAPVWSTPWAGSPGYVSRDASRLYHYLSLDDLKSGTGKNAVPIAEGFFVEGGKLYVRSSTPPSAHVFQIPALNAGVSLSGVSFVWIEGLEIRFYGEGDYGKGIDVTENAHDVVIRKNHVHDVPTLVWIRKGSAHVRVEDNELHQSTVFSWPWDAVKATDHENDAVSVQGGKGAIVSHNAIHDIFNGVYVGSFDDDHDAALAWDVDVFGNRFTRIGDDGLEPEGACVNARFWGNAVDQVHNGVSLAPITYGPTFVVRNRFTGYQESGFKVSNDTSGRVWLLHNTCFTDEADHNGMNVSGNFTNIVFRNNVIRGTSYSIESTRNVSGNDLDYDALYTTRGAPRVKWNDVRYDDLAGLCTAVSLECHGVGGDPALSDPAHGAFGPGTASPLVDAAVRLYGINDAFTGKAPDIGYVEAGATELPPL